MTAVLTLPRTARSTLRSGVRVDQITIDPVVQRVEGVDQRRIDRMAAAFDPDALGLLILSERDDGTLACLDGMHRCALIRQVGWTGTVDARVFTGLSRAEECSLFLLYNDKKDPSAVTKFQKRVLAGDEVAVDIDRIVTAQGWTVGPHTATQGVIVAAGAIERAYESATGALPKGAHPEVLARTLATVTGAWGRDPDGVQQTLIGGVSQLYGRFGDAVDTTKLVREMQGTQPHALLGKARVLKDAQGGTVAAALAKSLVGLHNSRRRSNLLPEWVWTR